MKSLIRQILRESTENYTVVKSSEDDKNEIYGFLYGMFPNTPESVLDEELFTIDYNISLVAKSNDKIIGCLLFSKDSICDYLGTTKILRLDKFPNLETLCQESGVKGVVYAIDPSFRGSSVNIDFIRHAKKTVNEFDYTYALVYSFLRTHNYWKRMGMSNYATVLDDGNVVEVYLLKFK
jgi:hypothetical protein